MLVVTSAVCGEIDAGGRRVVGFHPACIRRV